MSSSHGAHRRLLTVSRVWQLVLLAARLQITNRAWSTGELVERAEQMTHELERFLVADPAFLILIEVLPGGLEVLLDEGGYLVRG